MYCENYTFNQLSPIVDNRRTFIHEYAKQQSLLAAMDYEYEYEYNSYVVGRVAVDGTASLQQGPRRS